MGGMGGGMSGEAQSERQRVAVYANKGVNFQFADGSVHFRNESLDESANFYNRPMPGGSSVKNANRPSGLSDDFSLTQVPRLAKRIGRRAK